MTATIERRGYTNLLFWLFSFTYFMGVYDQIISILEKLEEWKDITGSRNSLRKYDGT